MAALMQALSFPALQRCLIPSQAISRVLHTFQNASHTSTSSLRQNLLSEGPFSSRLNAAALKTCMNHTRGLHSATSHKHCFSLRTVNSHFNVKGPGLIIARRMAQSSGKDQRNTSTVLYVCAIGITMVGLAYAGVPLYRIFCQATGRGGQATQGHDVEKVETMKPVTERVIRVRFNADVASSLQWNFRPEQREIRIVPGETALAFYSAKNPSDKPVIGISTYNVVPFEAGAYFNKIQCFCFEEQRLNPHEQVDMPVFFYIDPEFAEDPKMDQVDQIVLSYTFFEAKEGMQLPLPGYTMSQPQPS